MKACGCGRVYGDAEWAALPLLGSLLTEDETGRYLTTMKNCAVCGSTLATEEQVAS